MPSTEAAATSNAGGNSSSAPWRGLALVYSLAAAGVVALVAAVLIPTVIVGMLIKLPAEFDSVTVARGSGSLLDPASIATGQAAVEKDVPLEVTTESRAVAGNDESISVLQVTGTVRRTDRQGEGAVLSTSKDCVALDRSTATPVASTACPGDGASGPRGLQYQFPFDADKQDYQYFDTTTKTDGVLQFIDDETVVNGVRLLHFRNSVAPIDISGHDPATGSLTVPAAALGLPAQAPAVQLSMFYTATRDIWAEPVTGSIVRFAEQQKRYYAPVGGSPEVMTVVDMQVQFTPETENSLLADAEDGRRTVDLLERWIPIGLGMTGILTLAGAGVLWSRRPRSTS
ncbi:DUF3068 domain-containing protein [Nocardia sp. FBN12]|uniref:DUF3068 domain-containing protein n=1 Tax=Nocardia sp. FBN12 TaxID=3419766 RepID=UPI003D0851D4